MSSVERPVFRVARVQLYPGEILDRRLPAKRQPPNARADQAHTVAAGAAERVTKLWESWGLGPTPTDEELDRAATDHARTSDLEYFVKDERYWVTDGFDTSEAGSSEVSWIQDEGQIQPDGRIRFPYQDRAEGWEMDR
ncbi:hypothetical protein [Nocardia sp. NPDC057030]|uniref:hypothetical protein n=1 Tax=unclassified Nocardia TaxID=2637762 RepID=UPI00363CBBED